MLAAWGGHAAVQRRWPHWPRLHLAGIGVYYTFFLMTAVYVDNGRFLPLWHALPGLAFWLIPAAFGVPLIVGKLIRHPVMRDFDLMATGRVKRKV